MAAARLCDSSLCGNCTSENICYILCLFLLNSFWDVTENWAATFTKPVSHNSKSLSQRWTVQNLFLCKAEQFFPVCIVLCRGIDLPFSITRASCTSPQVAFKFPGKKKIVLPWKTLYPEKPLPGNCSLLVPFVSSVLGRLSLGTWGSPSDILHCRESCPAAGPCLWTSPLSVTEHSLVSHDSTASLKGFDEGPCQVSSGNTNRLY